MPPIQVLFCSHVVELGGAEMVLLDLLAELDRSRFTPHLAIPGDGPLTRNAKSLGVSVHEVPLAGNSKLGKLLALLRARKPLQDLAQQLDCHLLVPHSMIAGYAAVLAQRPGLGCVWHLHAVTRSRFARFHLRRARAVIAPSQAALDAAQLPNGHCIPNGVPARFFTNGTTGMADSEQSLRRAHAIPDDVPLLGIVGRLDPHKGHEVLLHSLAQPWPDGPSPHLFIVGGELFAAAHARLGGFADRLKELIQTLGLTERVHWLGEVPDPSPLLPQLDALIVPSISLESAPRTIAEAQAAGCPVVASNVGGIAEMLQNGDAGMLVPANNAHALQQGILKLLGDHAWRDRAVQTARKRAEQTYSLPAFARRCEAVFAQANTNEITEQRLP